MFIEIYKNSCKYYSKDRKLIIDHNEYGCSCSHNDGYKAYYLNDKLHNELGPAVIYPSGDIEYYLNDKYYSHDKWLEQLKKDM